MDKTTKKKTIFLTLPETFIARNIFYTDFWEEYVGLLENVHIILLVKPEKHKEYTERFQAENVTVVPLPMSPQPRIARLLNFFAISGVDTHTNQWEKERALLRGNSTWLVTQLKHFIAKTIGHSKMAKRALRAMMRLIPPPPELERLFLDKRPDLVVLTSLVNYDFDVRVGIEAKRRRIPIIGMPRSWDNFTSHGLSRVIPDVLVLENEYLRCVAGPVQGVDERVTPIRVIGLPHYDIYRHPESLLVSREEFCKKLGIDPAQKILLYGAMGNHLFPHEGAVATTLESVAAKGMIESPARIIFRAHPRFESPLEKMKGLVYLLPDTIAKHVGKDEPGKEIDLGETAHLINSLHHADVVITSASTFAVDAVALGRPTICIAYDCGAPDVKYWNSNERFYDSYTHFEALVETGGVAVVRSDVELARAINDYIADPAKDAAGRQKLLDLFVEPFDGNAGKRLATQIYQDMMMLWQKKF